MTRSIYFLLFVACSSFSVIAQQDTLSSQSYKKLSSFIERDLQTNPKLALKCAEAFAAKAEAEADLERQVLGLEAIGKVYMTMQDFVGYTNALDKAKKLIAENDLDYLVKNLYSQTARVYYYSGEWSRSLDDYNRALNSAQAENDIYSESLFLSQIAAIKIYAGNKKEAIRLNLLALDKAQQIPTYSDSLQKLKEASLLNNRYVLSRSYIHLEKPDSALYHIDKALALAVQTDSCKAKYLYYFQADAFLLKNELDLATRSLEKGDGLCSIHSKHAKLISNGLRGQVLLNKKAYRSSVDAFIRAFREYGVSEQEEGFMDDLYKLTAKAYKGLGNIDSANYYLEKYITSSSEFARISSDVKATSKRQEVAAFKQELEELAQEKSDRENLLLFGAIGGGVVILFLLISLLKSIKQRKEDEQKFKALLTRVKTTHTTRHIIDTKDVVLEEQSSSDVNPETTLHILNGLKKLEFQKYFLHPACSAHNVAKRIKTNTTYLSKVINAEFGKNFSTYVNDLRISYAVVRLEQDTTFRNYTISAIATELGYKSADSFTKYFKKDTGLLPSYYIKRLNEVA